MKQAQSPTEGGDAGDAEALVLYRHRCDGLDCSENRARALRVGVHRHRAKLLHLCTDSPRQSFHWCAAANLAQSCRACRRAAIAGREQGGPAEVRRVEIAPRLALDSANLQSSQDGITLRARRIACSTIADEAVDP